MGFWRRSSVEKRAAAAAASRPQAYPSPQPHSTPTQSQPQQQLGGGARADVTVLHPVTEAHLCQLAALENFAQHGVFVKFGIEEAVQLEARALDLAVQQSTQDAELTKRGLQVRSGIAATAPNRDVPQIPFTSEEATELLTGLRDDPLADVIALPPPARRAPAFPPRGAPRSGPHDETVPQGLDYRPKTKSFSAFKRRFVPHNERSGPGEERATASGVAPREPSAFDMHKRTGQSPGSDEFYASEAASRGYDMANGFVIPGEENEQAQQQQQHASPPYRESGLAAAAREEQEIVRAMTASDPRRPPVPGQYEEDEDALLAVALEESRIQAEYDDILREAILLRRDLEAELQSCRSKQVRIAQQHRDHLKRGDRATRQDGSGLPPHLAREVAESEHNLKEVDARVTAVSYAIQELSNLEHFIRTTQPSRPHAQALTEEIIRELLRQLSFLGLHFDYPGGPQETTQSRVDPSLVNAFRISNPTSTPPETPKTHQNHEGSPDTTFAFPTSLNPSPSQATIPEEPINEHPAPANEETVVQELDAQEAAAPAHTDVQSQQAEEETYATPGHTDGSSASSLDDVRSPRDLDTGAELIAGQAQDERQPSPETGRTSVWPLPAALASRMPKSATKPAAGPSDPPGDAGAVSGAFKRGPGKGTMSPNTESPPAWPQPSEAALRSLRSATSERQARPPFGLSAAVTPASEAAPPSEAKRVLGRASSRLQRLASQGAAENGDTVPLGRAQPVHGDITSVKRSSQVVHLYNELKKAMPERMERQYASPIDPEDGSDTSSVENGEGAAQEFDVRLAGFVADLGAELDRFRPVDMDEVVEFTESAETRLGSFTNQPSAALQNAPTFPLGWWLALRTSGNTWRQLVDLTMQQRRWVGHQLGSHAEEAARTEQALDVVRSKIEALTSKLSSREQRWIGHGVPWDRDAVKRARFASLHLAYAFMSGVMGEVTALEREATLQHEACLQHIADAVRVTYKAHQLAGGLHPEGLELFDQIKRLARYYVRVRDPTWLRTSTQLVGGTGSSGDQITR